MDAAVAATPLEYPTMRGYDGFAVSPVDVNRVGVGEQSSNYESRNVEFRWRRVPASGFTTNTEGGGGRQREEEEGGGARSAHHVRLS